jgi:hypothetical protein
MRKATVVAPASLALVATLVVLSPERDARAAGVAPDATRDGDVELMATSFVGDGLRFNNPYRLATPLGSTAESISRTAAYVDLGIGAVFGDPLGIRSGGALRMSVALEGVPQSVMTPSYLLWRRWRTWGVYGRAGVPVVLTPEVTWGLEVGAAAVCFVRGGIGIAGEVTGDLFYGAGTREVATPAYPVLSAQLGLVIDYEAFP